MASSARMRAGQVGILIAALLFAMAAVLFVGAKPAGASTNTTATGRGTTAQFTCNTGQQLSASINFQASKSKGTLAGGGSVGGIGVGKFFNISGGTLNNNSYSLSGFTTQDTCATFTSFVPFQVTLSGQCGTGVVIHYSDTAGETGDFIGNVVCT